MHTNIISTFIFQSPQQIQFYFPQFGNLNSGNTVALFANMVNALDSNGVQFSGSVFLGLVTILFADASGIYQLSPGKRTDTLYNTARDGTTSEVNILDPIADTGFLL